MGTEERVGFMLKRAGLRNTPHRRAVMIALLGNAHSTASDLESRIVLGNGVSGGMSRQGLYNVLEDLTRVKLLRRIEPAGSATRYELRVGDNHHHLVCRNCGRIEDVDCHVGQAPCLDPIEEKGFAVDEAEITWWGVCGECRHLTDAA